jgi:hypothetical protein
LSAPIRKFCPRRRVPLTAVTVSVATVLTGEVAVTVAVNVAVTPSAPVMVGPGTKKSAAVEAEELPVVAHAPEVWKVVEMRALPVVRPLMPTPDASERRGWGRKRVITLLL